LSWLDRIRPGINKLLKKKTNDTPDNLWVKCPDTGEMLYRADLEAKLWVTPSGRHMRVGGATRLKQLFDNSQYEEIDLPEVVEDPLKFKDDKKYVDRLKAARAANDVRDCMTIGFGKIKGSDVVIIVQDFAFMGGSLGMAAGEAFIKAAETAVAKNCAMICVTAAGGARMQEGILSLMQMPRTTLAIDALRDAGLPYFVLLTDPTTGGVTASYAMLGDIHIAEPGALIGFAGPRVIEQTIRQKLPPGFQRSEYLKEHGMVDIVVPRSELRETFGKLLALLKPKAKAA
jgi:acetyl-CoA carboxylase carboxyl transferase subunit beta